MKTKLHFLCLIITIGLASIANADKYNSVPNGFLTANNPANTLVNQNKGVQNSSVTIAFSAKLGESWDAIHDSNNLVVDCVRGDVLTGIEWNQVKIETVNDSWLSEANILLSDSNNAQGIELAIGNNDGHSGTGIYNSNGIFNFTDVGLNDITSLSDGKFPVQFYEEIDNIENSIEAYFTSGTITLWGENLSTSPDCPFSASVQSDLKVTLTSNAPDNINSNDDIALTLSIKNTGGSAATNVTISDTFIGLTFNDASCNDSSVGTFEDDIITINTSDISVNSTLLCTVNTTVTGSDELSYTSTVSSDNDPHTSNNSAFLLLKGAVIAIPAHNWLGLILLLFAILFFTRKLTD